MLPLLILICPSVYLSLSPASLLLSVLWPPSPPFLESSRLLSRVVPYLVLVPRIKWKAFSSSYLSLRVRIYPSKIQGKKIETHFMQKYIFRIDLITGP